jgi:hypothetical protein
MAKNAQRLSQLVSTFGPGAMIDLPTRSVVVGGLERWDMSGGSFSVISEPRLSTRLEKLLHDQGRLEAGVSLTLRTPPKELDAQRGGSAGVDAPVFPKWFICELVEDVGIGEGAKASRRRRLVRWNDLDSKGRRKFEFDDGRKSEVTPIRFVCACDNGHLDDINWRYAVHGPDTCAEAMYIEEKGTSADPADTSVVCGCSRRLSLQDLFQPGRLGKCQGQRPWLVDRDPAGCDQNLKLLTRTATNTYFPQVYTVISLPMEEDELSRLVENLAGDLAKASTVEHIAAAKMFNPKVEATLGPYSNADILERLLRLRENAQSDLGRPPQVAEFDVFASGRAEIGHNMPDAKLYAQTVPEEQWRDEMVGVDLSPIANLVAVHRLREVSCLYGFTRFEAAPASVDGDFEDIQLSVRGAPISQGADWLPAIEQFGEGLFIHFDAAKIAEWLGRPKVQERQDKLLVGYGHWRKRFSSTPPSYPGTPYVLLHSLSHALMSEIALDCGYPASSLKERIYALPSRQNPGVFDRCGILIYTATPGAQGTLGGLVATAPRFATLLKSALARLTICSSDPVCADHEPDDRSGDRATHGAACHSCLLISETSCERRNLFLDRDLLVRTMSDDGAELFTEVGPPD